MRRPGQKQKVLVALFFWFLSFVLLIGCSEKPAGPDFKALKYNQAVVEAIDREAGSNRANQHYLSMLRGLRWCVVFCDDDKNFDFTFTNYLTMLDELSLDRQHPAFAKIVHGLIQKEFERALPRLPKLFEADADSHESFVSILPIAYHHKVPLEPLKKFASTYFAGVRFPDRLKQFKQAARELNYDRLTDLVIGAVFVNMAYRCGLDRDFRLPPDCYQAVMGECAAVPFKRRYKDSDYQDQNYYATHVLLALNHYGRLPLGSSATSDRIFFYLTGQYGRVRNQVGDLDLLCEYLYCFKQFAPAGVGFIQEGERYILSQQRPDGSWGTTEDFEGDPYDKLHPTWTAITLLAQ